MVSHSLSTKHSARSAQDYMEGSKPKQLDLSGGLQIELCTCADCAPDLHKTCAYLYAWSWELCLGFAASGVI